MESLINGLKEFLTAEGAQTRRDILLLMEKVGNVQGQLDQTNYRLTDLHNDHLELRRDMNERFQKADERFDRLLLHMGERFQNVDDRLERLLLHMGDRFQKVDERFERLLLHMDDRFQKVDERFQKVDERFQKADERFERFEQRTDERLGRMVDRLDHMNQRLDSLILLLTPKHEHDALAARVDGIDQEVARLKKRLPHEAA